MFIDRVKIELSAGTGGNGIVAFRREKYVEFGGPAGGTGGKGGSIIFVGDEGLSTLLDLRYNKHIRALNGECGRGKGMDGANASDKLIRVPLGTTIYDDDTGKIIGDITVNGQKIVVARGGRGGRGNVDLATSRNSCPEICEKGEPGEHRYVRCELKVLADVGLVGFPSVGKSTLISVVSAAHPKIAPYHFTTLVPNLGMVRVPDGRSFVMADLPGLIEGASQGSGLGFMFLRHIERCRVIVHVIDMGSFEGRDPVSDYHIIMNELKEYKYRLIERPMILVANKMDLPNAKENLERFKKETGINDIIEISAYTKSNLDSLLYCIADTLSITPEFPLYDEDEMEKEISYKFEEEEAPFEIKLADDGLFEVSGKRLKTLFDMTNFENEESAKRFARQMRSLGVDDELRRLGVKTGDTVHIFDYDFEFFD